MKLATRTRPRAGYTLLEIALAAALLAVIAGSAVTVSLRGEDACVETSKQVLVDTLARRTLDRVAAELTGAGSGMLVPNPTSQFGTDSLSFRTPADFAGGAIVWGPRTRIAFAYETGEFDDGADNNGNGLVDEGVVTWTIDAGLATEHTLILCHGVRELGWREPQNGIDDDGDGLVDERGFSVRRSGDVLRLGLTLERLDAERHPIVRSLETTVQPRN
jgi:type II secretory pathway pseudopilin PulG